MSSKSPFLVLKELVSPLQAEDMVARLNHTIPNTDQKGHPTVTFKGNRLSESRVAATFNQLLPVIEEYYEFQTKTLTPFTFEWYPAGYSGQPPTSEGCQLISKRGQSALWHKIHDYDFTVVLFLNDFSDDTRFDERFEVRGGKLEFPTHEFGFNPERGTAIVYPCCPNFINAVSPVEAGDSNIARFHIIAKEEYKYDMERFPGDYTTWFS